MTDGPPTIEGTGISADAASSPCIAYGAGRWEMLLRALADFSRSASEEAVLERVPNVGRKLLKGAARCLVLRLEESPWRCCACAGTPGLKDAPTDDRHHYLADRILMERRPLAPDTAPGDAGGVRAPPRLLGAPIATGHGTAVVLVAEMPATFRGSPDDALARLALLAGHAGCLIENARLNARRQASEAIAAETRNALARREQELILSAKLACVGQLAASILHDLKGPMTVIRGYAEFLDIQAQGDGDTRQLEAGQLEEALRHIRQGVDHCNGIINQFLHVARPVDNVRLNYDVNLLVGDTLSFLRHYLVSHRIELIRRLIPGLPPVRADENQLRQVFINLFMNAVQAMPGGGRITVSSFLREDPTGGWICVHVADSGPGLPPGSTDRIFEPFFTTRHGKSEGGLGLGLAISRTIVQGHGGTLQVTSRPGEGCCFVVRLPAAVKTTAVAGYLGKTEARGESANQHPALVETINNAVTF